MLLLQILLKLKMMKVLLCLYTFIKFVLPFHTVHEGEGNGNPLQCSCQENPRDGGAAVGCRLWGHTESDTTEAT